MGVRKRGGGVQVWEGFRLLTPTWKREGEEPGGDPAASAKSASGRMPPRTNVRKGQDKDGKKGVGVFSRPS